MFNDDFQVTSLTNSINHHIVKKEGTDEDFWETSLINSPLNLNYINLNNENSLNQSYELVNFLRELRCPERLVSFFAKYPDLYESFVSFLETNNYSLTSEIDLLKNNFINNNIDVAYLSALHENHQIKIMTDQDTHNLPLGNYEGALMNGMMWGLGTYTYLTGEKLIGIWENNQLHFGTKVFVDGTTYYGPLHNGFPHGQYGTITSACKTKRYVCNFKHGYFDGLGIAQEALKSNKILETTWVEGEPSVHEGEPSVHFDD